MGTYISPYPDGGIYSFYSNPQGHKWKAKSHLPSYSNTTDESSAESRPAPDPCSSWYPGHRPFEAPEVNNIANFITTLPSLKAFVDLRSYG